MENLVKLPYRGNRLTEAQVSALDSSIKSKESITFRLESHMLSRLRKDANEEVISVNVLVNKIVKDHIIWHSIAPKAGFVPVRKQLVTYLLDQLTEEQVKAAAEQIARTTNLDFLMLLKNKISIDSAIDFIESWLRASNIVYRHERTENKHTFVIQHNMGRHWSIYLGELYTHLFEACKAREFTYEARDSTMTFVLDTGHWFD